MSVEFHCPSCGKKLFSYEIRERRFGSPLKECNKCKAEYLDPRFYEIALNGIPSDEFKLTSYVIMLAFGGFILWRGIHMFDLKQLGTPSEIQWLLPSILTIFGIALILAGVYEIVIIKTGLKKKKFEKIMEESRARIKSPTYVYKLRELGYPVPEQFTAGIDSVRE